VQVPGASRRAELGQVQALGGELHGADLRGQRRTARRHRTPDGRLGLVERLADAAALVGPEAPELALERAERR
jgi:hypothetical protein